MPASEDLIGLSPINSSLERHDPRGDRAQLGVGEVGEQRVEPARERHAVAVDARDELVARRRQPVVASRGRAALHGAADVAHAGGLRPRHIRRRRVVDDDHIVGVQSPQQARDRAVADRDDHAHRRRGARGGHRLRQIRADERAGQCPVLPHRVALHPRPDPRGGALGEVHDRERLAPEQRPALEVGGQREMEVGGQHVPFAQRDRWRRERRMLDPEVVEEDAPVEEPEEELVEEDLLVEDVSIDGMCGVY
jgi:mycofactocin precursor